MGNTANDTVIERLKSYLDAGWLSRAYRSNPRFAGAIQALRASDISFGSQASFFEGYLQGSCTATGEQKAGETTYERTVSIDFTTETYTFIPDGADAEVCKFAHRIFGGKGGLHSEAEKSDLAEKQGKKLARQDLSDLNFSMKSYRLNRHSLIETDRYKLPAWPIFASVNQKRVRLGYWYEMDGEIRTDFDITVPLTGKQKLIIAGIAAGVILAIILLVRFL